MSDWRIIWNKALDAKEKFVNSNDFSQFEVLLEKYPNDGMVYYALGGAYESKGLIDKSIESYRNAYSLFPMIKWKLRAKECIERLTNTNVSQGLKSLEPLKTESSCSSDLDMFSLF